MIVFNTVRAEYGQNHSRQKMTDNICVVKVVKKSKAKDDDQEGLVNIRRSNLVPIMLSFL